MRALAPTDLVSYWLSGLVLLAPAVGSADRTAGRYSSLLAILTDSVDITYCRSARRPLAGRDRSSGQKETTGRTASEPPPSPQPPRPSPPPRRAATPLPRGTPPGTRSE